MAASFTKALVRLDIIQRIYRDVSHSVAVSNLADLLGVGPALRTPCTRGSALAILQTDRESLEGLMTQTSTPCESWRPITTISFFHRMMVNRPETSSCSPPCMSCSISLRQVARTRRRKTVPQRLSFVFDTSHGRPPIAGRVVLRRLGQAYEGLGDKQLVVEAAIACVEATTHDSRSLREAECEARARICGLSWAYQRMGRLDLAADEAEKSLVLSKT